MKDKTPNCIRGNPDIENIDYKHRNLETNLPSGTNYYQPDEFN